MAACFLTVLPISAVQTGQVLFRGWRPTNQDNSVCSCAFPTYISPAAFCQSAVVRESYPFRLRTSLDNEIGKAMLIQPPVGALFH